MKIIKQVFGVSMLCAALAFSSCQENSSFGQDAKQDEGQQEVASAIKVNPPQEEIIPSAPPPVVEIPVPPPIPEVIPMGFDHFGGLIAFGGGGGRAKVARCGNGRRDKGERCDDANNLSGDGCAKNCTVEEGFICEGSPSDCRNCGNGVIAGAETCDDGNTVSEDGCSATCTIEEGFVCPGVPSICQNCGNGLIEGTEECDDNGSLAGDGCSATCTIEEGFQCQGEPSACELIPLRAFLTSTTTGDNLVLAANSLPQIGGTLTSLYNCSANTYVGGPYNQNDGNSGVEAADCLCRARAASQVNELRCADATFGCWKAWIADSSLESAPVNRFNMAQGGGSAAPILQVDALGEANPSTPIATGGWLDLIVCGEGGSDPEAANCLDDPLIDTLGWFSELGARFLPGMGGLVPSNVNTDGTRNSATNHCSDWAAAAGNGVFGDADAINNLWTANGSVCVATALNPLYCFEDP